MTTKNKQDLDPKKIIQISKTQKKEMFGKIVQILSNPNTRVTHNYPNDSWYCIQQKDGFYCEVFLSCYTERIIIKIDGIKYESEVFYRTKEEAELRHACETGYNRTKTTDEKKLFNGALEKLNSICR